MKRTICTWSLVDDQQLIRWTRECVPVGEIAERLGKSYSAVVTRRMRLKREGRIKRLGYAGHRQWTPAEAIELKTLWQEGKSYRQLAKHFNRTETAIILKLKRLGISRRRERKTLTCRDIADIMGLGCAKTVVTWVERGWIKPLPTGRKRTYNWRFDELALWSFVENPEAFVAWKPERITDPDLQAHALEHRAKHPRWLSIGEVAKRYHVLHMAVNDWVNSGLFPFEALVKYPNWWIREDVLTGFVPPCERPRSRKSGRLQYLCCHREAPLELAFATDRDERICDDCRQHYRIHTLSNNSVLRIYPLVSRTAKRGVA